MAGSGKGVTYKEDTIQQQVVGVAQLNKEANVGECDAVSRACLAAFNACVYKFCTPFVAGQMVGGARGRASF